MHVPVFAIAACLPRSHPLIPLSKQASTFCKGGVIPLAIAAYVESNNDFQDLRKVCARIALARGDAAWWSWRKRPFVRGGWPAAGGTGESVVDKSQDGWWWKSVVCSNQIPKETIMRDWITGACSYMYLRIFYFDLRDLLLDFERITVTTHRRSIFGFVWMVSYEMFHCSRTRFGRAS